MTYIISAKTKLSPILYFFGPFETQEEADVTWTRLEADPVWTPDEMPVLNSMDTLDEGAPGPEA